MYTINCKGVLLPLDCPVVMGIINATPDSFYAESRHKTIDAALRQAEKMLTEGATILDIGGVSTRPGASEVSCEEELRRVIPIITAIAQRFAAIISVDSYRAEVAQSAVAAGASMVNDVSGGGRFDPDLLPAVGELGVPYILMHSIATPQTMQIKPEYDDVVLSVMDFFIQKIPVLRSHNITDIIIDLGFGFGKTHPHNFALLRRQADFSILGLPILTGVSRKSMIYSTLGLAAQDTLPATTALHLYALQHGANLLRVHDVKEAVQAVKLWECLR